MVNKSAEPGLAQDLIRIHKVITRGLEVGLKYSAQFAGQGFPDARLQQGFHDYVHSLIATLEGHHLSEDEIAFPALRSKIPGAPYDRLAADHQVIEGLIVQAKSALAEPSKAALEPLNALLAKIEALWGPHIQVEESHFTGQALSAVMGPGEQGQMSAEMARLSQERANPGYLVLPFVLYNLEAEDRAAMIQVMPKVIVEELVPIAWKDQWAPMKPFLLE